MSSIRAAYNTISNTRAIGVRWLLVAGFILTLASVSLGGAFVAFGPKDFDREPGNPVPAVNSFTVPHPNKDYTLRIDNGGLYGKFKYVSSALITFNGIEVVHPNDFNQKVAVIEKPIMLSPTNILTVEVRSKPGSGLTFQIIGDNEAPIADAGPDYTAFGGDTVTLDGSGSSDPDGDPLTFDWSLISVPPGSVTTLSDPHVIMPTLTAHRPGIYIAQLAVRDGIENSSPDTVTITVLNTPPVAHAGDDLNALTLIPVFLDGSASYDPDGDLITFDWSLLNKPAGSTAGIIAPTQPNLSFRPDLPGDYLFELLVDDGEDVSLPDQTTVTAFTGDVPPNARAGRDQSALVGAPVQLDGSASFDPNQDPLAFSWSFDASPPDSIATILPLDSSTPQFMPDVEGAYSINLQVSDGTAADDDIVEVTVSHSNVAPHADAGPELVVQSGPEVVLDGGGSFDPDFGPSALQFAWAWVSVPADSSLAQADLRDAMTPAARFTPDGEGMYLLRLTVSDGDQQDGDNVLVMADDTPPTIHFVSPTEGGIVTSSTPELTLAFSDVGAGTNPKSLVLTLDDGQALDLVCALHLTHAICTPTVNLLEGPVTLLATIADRAGNVSYPAEVDFTIDTTPPTVILTNPPDGVLTNQVAQTFVGQVSEPASLTIDGQPVTLDVTNAFDHGPVILTEGLNTFNLVVTDLAGNIGQHTVQVTLDTQVPAPVDPGQIVVSDITDGQVVVRGPEGSVEPGAVVHMTNIDTGDVANAIANPDGSFSVQIAAQAGDALSIVITDGAGNGSEPTEVGVGSGIPPDPGAVAPPIDSTVATTMFDATAFLYSARNPIQKGVTEGTIEQVRAAVIRGQVLTRDNGPLSEVVISILNHPEYGNTVSREDGMFDLAVNGGGLLTVEYEREGFLTVQRQVDVPWQDYAFLPDVVMISSDPKVTVIDLDANVAMQMAQGHPVTDSDGFRQATLLFPHGTQATMMFADGSSQPISTLSVRATEYTVGQNGPSAMPAILPSTSAYTYAVEFSADEAVVAGATEVRFTQPVISYVENFMNMPVGDAVPAGYYDRQQGRWIASDNGLIIAIVSVTAGLADLDITGNGTPDDAQALSTLNITDAERERLAVLYQPGQSLWRIPIAHFTPWDWNWPFTPLPGAKPPELFPPRKPDQDDSWQLRSSIIEAQNQALGKTIEIVGTPFSLNYRSSRVPGSPARSLLIPLTGPQIIPDLRSVELVINVAGRRIVKGFPPEPDLQYLFVWDGLDAYGRPVQGAQPVTATVTYNYRGFMISTSAGRAFARAPGDGATITSNLTRGEVGLSQRLNSGITVGGWDARGQGLGGWTLNLHHSYDPAARVLYLGTGERRSAVTLSRVIHTIAGSGLSCPPFCGDNGDGGPATEARLTRPRGVAVGPDGSVYIADGEDLVRKVSRDGTISTVVGQLHQPGPLALGPDGSLYIADVAHYRILRLRSDGVRVPVAGTGVLGGDGDNGPATEAQIDFVSGMAVAPDGSLYFIQRGDHRIRRVGPDGIVTTIAGIRGQHCGTFSTSCGSDGDLATESLLSIAPGGLAVGPDGSVYFGEEIPSRIRRISPDGIMTTVVGTGAGCGSAAPCGDGGPATQASISGPRALAVGPDGTLYFAEGFRSGFLGGKHAFRIRQISPDGIITTVVGTNFCTYSGDDGPATQAQLCEIEQLAIGPDNGLYIADRDNHRVRRVTSSLPGFLARQIAIPSEDGTELYQFDANGRHLRTFNTFTGVVRYQFDYDDAGRLIQVKDGNGNVTTVERDAEGNPTAIIGPYGHPTVLHLEANGYIASLVNPANERAQMTYTDDGLLETFTNPKGATFHYTYNDLGRLITAQGPAGGMTTLSRAESERIYEVTVATALGRTTTNRVEFLPTGTTRRISTDPSGAQTELLIDIDGSRTVTYPDGTVIKSVEAPDPRFGMQAPYIKSATMISPQGLTSTRSNTRTAILAEPDNPFSLQTLTETTNVNGSIHTTFYDASLRKITNTSAEGNQSVSTLDAQGRVVQYRPAPGLDLVTFSYDDRGRRIQIEHGNQFWKYTYDDLGRISSRTNANGHQLEYAYDAADRLIETVMPDGGIYQFAHDANGNRTEVTLPQGAQHILGYDTLNFETDYIPPDNEPYTRSFDKDHALNADTRPSGQTIDSDYDGAGRLVSMAYTDTTVDFAYTTKGVPGNQVQRITRTSTGGGTIQEITFAYDGEPVTQVAFNGVANGSFSYRYNENLFMTGLTIDAEPEIDLSWDDDGRLTNYGPFTLTRGGPARATSQLTDGILDMTLDYDSLGRLVARTHTVNAQPIYNLQLTYDPGGRIINKVESVLGLSHSYDYTYDVNSRLTQVERDGDVVETYVYDSNGNRLATLTTNASYDVQDRLIQQGDIAYQFDVDGLMGQRGSETFQYSTRGELLAATVSGQAVHYTYDGLGRRVGRTDDVGTIQYLYGNPDHPFQVTASRAPSGSLSLYYYDEEDHLYAIQRDGAWFYVATDQVGTPLVVSDAQGQEVGLREYDSFGRLITDSDPAFPLSIGFAGGLEDKATGLVRFGLRDYDPLAGRWTARDPVLFARARGSLYAYAKNNPISLRDPAGLFSVGVSGFFGIGGGIKWNFVSSKGSQLCFEIGLGFGGGLELDPQGQLDHHGARVDIEATVSAGPFKAGVGAKLTDCGDDTTETKCGFGPLGCRGKLSQGLPEETNGRRTEWDIKSPKAEAKISANFCFTIRL